MPELDEKAGLIADILFSFPSTGYPALADLLAPLLWSHVGIYFTCYFTAILRGTIGIRFARCFTPLLRSHFSLGLAVSLAPLLRSHTCPVFSCCIGSCYVSSVYHRVCTVFLVGTPSEVTEVVVGWISVWKMTAFVSRRTRPYEGQQYEFVDTTLLPLSFPEKSNTYVALYVDSLEKLSAASTELSICYNDSFQGFHPAPVRDSVQPFVPGNVSPQFPGTVWMPLNFLVEDASPRIRDRHGSAPYQQDCVGKGWNKHPFLFLYPNLNL